MVPVVMDSQPLIMDLTDTGRCDYVFLVTRRSASDTDWSVPGIGNWAGVAFAPFRGLRHAVVRFMPSRLASGFAPENPYAEIVFVHEFLHGLATDVEIFRGGFVPSPDPDILYIDHFAAETLAARYRLYTDIMNGQLRLWDGVGGYVLVGLTPEDYARNRFVPREG